MEIIESGIETNKKNYTRFFILQLMPNEDIIINKASLHFSLHNTKGALANALIILFKHNMDLSMIESLPVIGEPWHYHFFVDVLFENVSDYHKVLKKIRITTRIYNDPRGNIKIKIYK